MSLRESGSLRAQDNTRQGWIDVNPVIVLCNCAKWDFMASISTS